MRPQNITPRIEGMHVAQLLGVLALGMLVIGILLLVLQVSGALPSGPAGNAGRVMIMVAVLLALGAFAMRRTGSLLEKMEVAAEPHLPVPVGSGRMKIARACSVLALVCLAGGSALLATASVLGDDIEERVWPVMFIWPPTFILTWAFATAAFAAKGMLEASAAVVAFFVGIMSGWIVLATTMASPVMGVSVLVGINAAAVYFVRREVWDATAPPAGGAIATPPTGAQ